MMSIKYFDIPFYKRLTTYENWEQLDDRATHYHIARAFFRLNIRQLPGPAKIGRKFDVLGHAKGITTERIKIVELERNILHETKTIKESIIETECIIEILNKLYLTFGDKKLLKKGGTLNTKIRSEVKNVFQQNFAITKSVNERKLVRYEFKDTLPSNFNERVCGVEVYQECIADLYLIQIDFLHIKYERSMFGLRKKIKKEPFPNNKNGKHPNIIKIGAPVASLKFYQLLPNSSLIIKDKDYSPDITDDSTVEVIPVDPSLKDRPYWGIPKHPTLYQLAHVAFPYKWINKKHNEFTKEELMEIELGEAEGSAWWFIHGPGRNRKA